MWPGHSQLLYLNSYLRADRRRWNYDITHALISICSSSSSTSSDELWDTSRRTNSWHRKKAVSCHSPCWPRPGKHLLFTLKANLDIRCPMQSRPGLKMTTVCLNQHLNHQLQQPRLLFFFRISYINVWCLGATWAIILAFFSLLPPLTGKARRF